MKLLKSLLTDVVLADVNAEECILLNFNEYNDPTKPFPCTIQISINDAEFLLERLLVSLETYGDERSSMILDEHFQEIEGR